MVQFFLYYPTRNGLFAPVEVTPEIFMEHSLTCASLTISEAQDVIDSIFSSPLNVQIDEDDHEVKSVPHSSHPGRVAYISKLSGSGTFSICYLLHFEPLSGFCPTDNQPAMINTNSSIHQLVLKIAPPPNVRLLRHESTPTPLLAIEAYLLNLLGQQVQGELGLGLDLSIPLPRVLAYDDTLTLLDSPFLLTTSVPGIPLDHLLASGQLTATQAKEVGMSVGRLLRAVNETHAGVGVGGWGGAWGMVTGQPGSSAQEWFIGYVEGLLRDGEDMRVLLPYEEVRRAVEKWGPLLNSSSHDVNSLSTMPEKIGNEKAAHEISTERRDILDETPTHPRLCILDFSASSVLIDPVTAKVTGLINLERASWGDPIAQEVFLPIVSSDEAARMNREDVIMGYNSWPIPTNSMPVHTNIQTNIVRSATSSDCVKRVMSIRRRRCRELL